MDGVPEVWPWGSLFQYVFKVLVGLETFDEVVILLVPFRCHNKLLELRVGLVDV